MKVRPALPSLQRLSDRIPPDQRGSNVQPNRRYAAARNTLSWLARP